MRLIAFLFLQLASIAVAYCATSQDKKVSADQLYTQVTRLVPQMEQTRDSVTYYQLLYKSFSLALVCDSIDVLPNKKGKSLPRYRKQLFKLLRTQRQHLIDGGMMYYARHDNPMALKFSISICKPIRRLCSVFPINSKMLISVWFPIMLRCWLMARNISARPTAMPILL